MRTDKCITTVLAVMMVISGLGLLTLGSDTERPESQATTFTDVYHTPRYPIGHDWITTLGGDIIELYAFVEGDAPSYVELDYIYCNRTLCPWPPDPDGPPYIMTPIGGGWYYYLFAGDWHAGQITYEYSDYWGSYVKYRVIAWDGFGGELATYPGGFDKIAIYPAREPTSINVTVDVEPTVPAGGDFMVNGYAHYWNSTKKPFDLDPLRTPLPADECDVTVTIDGTPFIGKTDIDGNFSIQVTAPITPGFYMINTTVTNSTPNRNKVCHSDDVQVEVLATSTFDIPLQDPTGPWPDWRLISFPIAVSGDVTTILDDSIIGDSGTTWDIVQWYDAQNQEWKSYATYKPASLNNLQTLDNTMGLWVHITANDGNEALTTGLAGIYSGSPVDIDLYTGWNMVGYPSETDGWPVVILPPEADFIALYDSGQYHILDVPVGTAWIWSEGNAYWVHVTADCIWSVTP